ncbi:MAG: DegT/DnrJ/EryC1/StrS family aminotransferase [Desulfomonile sp.]|nr:DegT/DnrJ/EryC1/StrS family aminotransferase [Desulfomonile sp.]
MHDIPLVDLKAQVRAIRKEIAEAVLRSLESADYILGREVTEFETEFARYVGTKHAVGVASGTDALVLMLRACGIGPGHEVILPANTFVATAFAVSHCGARPVPVDVSEADFNIDLDRAAAAVTKATRAILPVHLFGLPADMDRLRSVANDTRLVLLEDACQAHGASYQGTRVGGLAAAAAFSFYPAKNLGACGDGGMVTTNDDEFAASVQMLRNYGQPKKYHHDLLGYNSRLDTLQAAILRVKLRRLDEWNARRRSIADLYRRLLADAPVKLPVEPAGRRHVYHLFVIRTERRDELLAHLNALGIGAGIHYPVPIHLHAAYRELGYRPGDFPVSERLCREILSLPIYPEMTEEQVAGVAEAVKDYFANR